MLLNRLKILLVAVMIIGAPAKSQESDASSPREVLVGQANALRGFVDSGVAETFLNAVPSLPSIPDVRVVYLNRATRDAVTEAEAALRPDSTLANYERLELDEEFYYFTRYGTPLAFVRPLDLMGQAGLATLDGLRIIDFGFGSIGQLRVLAASGASALGIEVDQLLRALYCRQADTGRVARAPGLGDGPDGEVVLRFGRFPAEQDLVNDIGGGYNVFVSKNTLKNGYIHPSQEVDPRMLVHLGVGDEAFVRAVYRVLEPGGYFMIYNLCPPQSKDRYIPWADGRCPFSRDVLEKVGFELIAYDRDDTAAAREMGERLGWGDQMNLATDLFGIYTLARKK